MDIPDELFDKYHMHSVTKELIYGTEIKDGMIVLVADAEFRAEVRPDMNDVEMYETNKLNCYCRVSKVSAFEDRIYFIGEYSDGTKSVRSSGKFDGWYVLVGSLDHDHKYDRIESLLSTAMLSRPDPGSDFDINLTVLYRTATKINNMFTTKTEAAALGFDYMCGEVENKIVDHMLKSNSGTSIFDAEDTARQITKLFFND